MKKLLITTAILEVTTGILLVAFPLFTASVLVGAKSLDDVALTIVRITGSAIISLAIACWLSRQKDNAINVAKAMLFYNIAVTSVLIYGNLDLGLKGIGLLPAIVVHLVLAIWGIIAIRTKTI